MTPASKEAMAAAEEILVRINGVEGSAEDFGTLEYQADAKISRIIDRHFAAREAENTLLRAAFALKPTDKVVGGNNGSILVDSPAGARTRVWPVEDAAREAARVAAVEACYKT